MMDFQIKRTSRRCRTSGRDLQPGEEYISELVVSPTGESGEFARHDYALEAWQGPAANSVGWWRCRIPAVHSGKVFWAPADVQREYFSHLLQSPQTAAQAFLMAMLLVRRRMLRLEAEETDEAGQRWMIVVDPERQTCRVRVVELSLEEREAIQQEFAEHLFTDQPGG
jgi:hypothetical protein